MREAAGEAGRRGRERERERERPRGVRFRAGPLTRWRAGRVGSAFHRKPYNAPLTLLYLTPTHLLTPTSITPSTHTEPSSDSYLSMPSLYIASLLHDAIMRSPHYHLATCNCSFRRWSNDPEQFAESSAPGIDPRNNSQS